MKTVYLNMKATKAAFFCALFLFCSLAGFAQTTARGFNYQAIARDASGNPVVNKNITVELSIRQDNVNGTIVWQETHSTSTNDYGLFVFVIGQGTSTGAGTLSSMNMVNWGAGNYYVQVWADFGAGLTDMGTTELQSVPYAMMADSAMTGPKYPLSQAPDVNVTGLAPNMILMWNGTQWVATNPATTIEAGLNAKIQNDSAYLSGLINTETTNRTNADNGITSAITTDSAALATMINNSNNALNTFEGLPSGQMYVGNSNNMATPVTMTGDATLTNVGMMTIANNAITTSKILDGSVTDSKIMVGVDATKIADGSVSNTDFENISATKGNLQTQITANANNIATNTSSINAITNLPSGEMYVGNASNTATQVSMSGDATMSNTGAITIANGAVTNNKMATGIDAAKIANGMVSNTQFQYLQGASSNIQSQINTIGNIALTDEDSIRSLETQVGANTANIAANTSNITGLQTSVQSFNTTTTSLQSQINTNDAGIAANAANIVTDESNITNLQGGVQSLNTTTTSLQNQINTNDEAIAGNTSNITSLQNQVTTNTTNIATDELHITTLQTSVQTLNGEIIEGYSAINMLNTTVANIIDTMDNIGTAVAGNTAAITTNATNIATLQNQVNTNTSNIADISSGLETLSGTTVTLETQMTIGEAQIQQLNSLPSGQMFVGNSSNETTPVTMSGDATMDNTGAVTITSGLDVAKLADGSVNNTTFEYLDGATSNIQNQLNTIGAAESTDATNITTLQNQVNTNTSNIADISTGLETLSGTTVTLETQMTIGEAQIQQLNSLPSGQMFVGNSSNETTPVTMSGDATMDNTGAVTITPGLDAAKLADGSVNNTTFEYLDGATSNIQNQLNTIGVAESTDATNITTLQNQVNTNTSNIADISTGLETLSGTTVTLETQMTIGEAQIQQLNSLPSGQMFVGNAMNVTTPVSMSGAISMDNTGNTTINNGVVTGSNIAAATITGANIANSTIGVNNLSATGTADNTTFLRGDGTWAAVGGSSIPSTISCTSMTASEYVKTPTILAGDVVAAVQTFSVGGSIDLNSETPYSIIVLVNNTSSGSITITTSASSSTNLLPGYTGVFLKTGINTFTLLMNYTI